jgi:glycosyltransferase involved in cell wall biosynthesis
MAPRVWDSRKTRAGLVGYAVPTGLGIATRDFYRHLPFDRWLVVRHLRHGVDDSWLDARCTVWDPMLGLKAIDQWMRGLDVVFSIQTSYISSLWLVANHHRVRIVTMPNAEWFDPTERTLHLVDTFIAPTEACATYLESVGCGGRVTYVPHVVDTERFRFAPRRRADQFVHCRGWGGHQQRKGTDLVIAAARRCPDVPFVIRYQGWDATPVPDNVTLVGAVTEPEAQYDLGDVAIQPSRWEGVGLQILEAMSCGLPTLVADAPPMNEYPTSRALCVPAASRPVRLGGKPWLAWEMELDALVDAIRALHGTSIESLSAETRARMESRSWQRLGPVYAGILGF